jgi:hypothetical protein
MKALWSCCFTGSGSRAGCVLALGFWWCIHYLWLLILWFRFYSEEPFSNAKKVPPKGLAPPCGPSLRLGLPSLRRCSGGRRERPSLAAHGFLGILASLPPAQRLRSAVWFYGASFRNLIFNSHRGLGTAAICRSQLVGEDPSDLPRSQPSAALTEICASPESLWDRIYSGSRWRGLSGRPRCCLYRE